MREYRERAAMMFGGRLEDALADQLIRPVDPAAADGLMEMAGERGRGPSQGGTFADIAGGWAGLAESGKKRIGE